MLSSDGRLARLECWGRGGKGHGEGEGKMRKRISYLRFLSEGGSPNMIVTLANSARAGPAFYSCLNPLPSV